MSDSSFRAHFDEALEAIDSGKSGIALAFDDPGKATAFRLRMNKFRASDRERNKSIHPDGHPMHGKSVYDSVSLFIDKDSPSTVKIRSSKYIEPTSSTILD